MLHVRYVYLSSDRKPFCLRHCSLLLLFVIFSLSRSIIRIMMKKRNKINDLMTNARLSPEEPELASCPARQGQGVR